MAGQDAPFPDLGGLTFGEDVFYRLLDDFLSAGVVGSATDYQVIQNHLGANMSVDVNPGSGYVAIANGGKRRTRLPAQSNSGLPGSPNSADNWTTTFVSADPTNPRVDRVVLTAQDSSVDGSGFYRSILRVVAGTPTSGATLANLNGAASVPANSILLANVLVPNSATTVTTANIADQRPISKLGAGNAQLNVQAGVVPVATTIAALNALLAGGAPVAGQKGVLRVMPTTYNNGGATALPAGTLTVGSTAGFPTAGTVTTPNGAIAYTGKTGTTLTGCTGGTGTLAAGAAITLVSVSSGAADYDIVNVVYDAVIGKWVAGSVVMSTSATIVWTPSASAWVVNSLPASGHVVPLTSRWRWYEAAGLKPQAKFVSSLAIATTAAANGQLRAHWYTQNFVDGFTLVDAGADVNSAGPIVNPVPVGAPQSAPMTETLWADIPAGYTIKDTVTVAADFFCTAVGAGNVTAGSAQALLRWVG